MQNPFTTTFSKIPDYTYIPTEQTSVIIDNFSYDSPSESVYKITGVRGSGKTVLLAKIEDELNAKDNWHIYRINPGRDMLKQLAVLLHRDGFSKSGMKSIGISLSASILGTGGGIGYSSEKNDEFFDYGIEIESMLENAKKCNTKILIGVDEISKTPDMIMFTLEFGKWLRAGYPIYMVCTGLYENIERIYNVKNLTFFRRASTIQTSPLNTIRMTEMYKNRLEMDQGTAHKLADITKGYAYAFQELGVLVFRSRNDFSMDSVISDLKTELFSYSYEKIWEELTDEDKKLVRILSWKDELKRDEILSLMDKPSNYSMYRDRLLKRGIISARHGYLSLLLPFFGDYINEYCM